MDILWSVPVLSQLISNVSIKLRKIIKRNTFSRLMLLTCSSLIHREVNSVSVHSNTFSVNPLVTLYLVCMAEISIFFKKERIVEKISRSLSHESVDDRSLFSVISHK